jgi:hypothetical protein
VAPVRHEAQNWSVTMRVPRWFRPTTEISDLFRCRHNRKPETSPWPGI